jgi:hypothetical protein
MLKMKIKCHGYLHYIKAKILIAGASLCGALVGLGGAVYHIARLDVKKAALSLGATLMSLVNTAAQTVKAAAGGLGAGHFVKKEESLKKSCASVLTGYNWIFVEYGSDGESEKKYGSLEPSIAKTALFRHYFKFMLNGSIPKMLENGNSYENSSEFNDETLTIPIPTYRKDYPLGEPAYLNRDETFYIPYNLK